MIMIFNAEGVVDSIQDKMQKVVDTEDVSKKKVLHILKYYSCKKNIRYP